MLSSYFYIFAPIVHWYGNSNDTEITHFGVKISFPKKNPMRTENGTVRI